jgi:hypothetical protein
MRGRMYTRSLLPCIVNKVPPPRTVTAQASEHPTLISYSSGGVETGRGSTTSTHLDFPSSVEPGRVSAEERVTD